MMLVWLLSGAFLFARQLLCGAGQAHRPELRRQSAFSVALFCELGDSAQNG